FAMRRFEQVYAMKRVPRHVLSVLPGVTVNKKIRPDEFVAGRSFWKRIELRAVTYRSKHRLGLRSARTKYRDAAPCGSDQTGHQVHQRRLARTVWPHKSRDARLDLQVHPVDPEDLTIELRYVFEDDQSIAVRLAHRTTSYALTFCEIRNKQASESSAREIHAAGVGRIVISLRPSEL